MSLTEFFDGFKMYFKANRLVTKHKMWSFLTIPGIMSVLYILVLIILGTSYLPDMSAFIDQNLVPEFMQGEIMQTIMSILLWLLLIIIMYISYREVVLVLFSPILSYLSEKVEKIVYNQEPPPFNLKNLMSDIIRAVKLEIKGLTRMLILTFLAWLLTFLPVIGAVISPVIILLIQSYYGGLRFTDYTLERKRYSVEESIYFAKTNKPRITGVGLGFTILMMVPIVGWFVAPSYGTIAGTLSALEKINSNDPEILKIMEL